MGWTCRMRMDPKNDNYNMFDLIAYRIKFTPHPHAGRTWCALPFLVQCRLLLCPNSALAALSPEDMRKQSPCGVRAVCHLG